MRRGRLIALLYASGQTAPEVALQLGLNQGTIRTHLKRERKRLGLTHGTKVDLHRRLTQEGAIH
jgi:DNA-binding CsgD family transcriptional regulator